MALSIDIGRLPVPAQRILKGEAPAPARLMAASGIIPGLKPGDVVTVVAALTLDADGGVAAKARETLLKLPPPILNGALSADLETPVITILADHYSHNAEVVAPLLRMPRIDEEALVILAERADEKL